MLVYFIGQSVTFHTGKKVLVVIIQLYMFAMIIMSNLYQGEMTAFMTTPLVEHRIKTIEEFSQGNFKIATDELFKSFAAENYPRIHGMIKYVLHETLEKTYSQHRQENIAFIYKCDEFTQKFYYLIFDGFAEHYYLIPEIILPYYRFYDTCYGSPFAAKWQEYMDWSFSTGLHQHWEFLLSQEFSYIHEVNSIEEEDSILRLGDMVQMFYIYAVGLTAGTLVFLGEIGYTYFVGRIVRMCLRLERIYGVM